MCGIVGVVDHGAKHVDFSVDSLGIMLDKIKHRGPDGAGVWCDTQAGVFLGHRRLAVLDLTDTGKQPMDSHCGRYVIVFNGEIYNHIAVRRKLEEALGTIAWKGTSDTETLLCAISKWGIQRALIESNGMFALAVWDRQAKSLTLARDRFGEKPLYYGYSSGAFVFSSEVEAFTALPFWKNELNMDAVEDYLRFGCITGNLSIYKDTFKLTPGTFVCLSLDAIAKRDFGSPVKWWSTFSEAESSRNDGVFETVDQALGSIDHALRVSVDLRMISDVPVGAFLSGGIDSSLVVALMTSQSKSRISTFSIGFDDKRFDESGDAEKVSRHLGTDHHTLYVGKSLLLDAIPKIQDTYDEPFSDSSQLPTMLLSRLTRDHVTVALSGDGGDELFGGYNRHVWVPRIWKKIGSMPIFVKKTLSSLIRSIPSASYDDLAKGLYKHIAPNLHVRSVGFKMYKLADALCCESANALFYSFASMNRNPKDLLLSRGTAKRFNGYQEFQDLDIVEWMMLMDTVNYMVDDVLVKVDRASMASSLEVRVPFLDPELFRQAWKIPSQFKVRGGQGKWILRQLLYKYVPQHLVDRPKMGFAVPLDEWLKNELRDWAEDLLSQGSLTGFSILDSAAVIKMWKLFLAGKGQYEQQLWSVLQLLAWSRAHGVKVTL